MPAPSADVFDHETYLSPLTWRYGSEDMRALFSEAEKRRLWRQLWVRLAEAQQKEGLVATDQVEDLRAHAHNVDIARAHEIEKELSHDLMAEVHAFAEQAKIGGPVIHLGATSMDIEDNTDAIRLARGLALVRLRVRDVLECLGELISTHAETATMGFTHLQPAEPITLGFRFATWARDLLDDYKVLGQVLSQIRGKGMRGAVGSSASYLGLYGNRAAVHRVEAHVLSAFHLEGFDIATQTYPRKQDMHVVNALAGVGQSIYRLAFDMRILQSPPFGELAEPFGKKQIGSSAMPFKKNPIHAENMNSLARQLASLPRVAWDNAAHCLLERTLDDSANRRSVLPQAFLLSDELLRRALRVLSGIEVRKPATDRLLATYGVFAATEKVLMAASKAGADRQHLHEVIRQHAMTAWTAMQEGRANPLVDSITNEKELTRWLPSDEIRKLLDAGDHVGDCADRARLVLTQISDALAQPLSAAESAHLNAKPGAKP